MKLQDIVFFILGAVLFYKQNATWLVIGGLGLLLFSIPLFAIWIFFTAERMTYYAAGFFLLSIIINLIQLKKRNL